MLYRQSFAIISCAGSKNKIAHAPPVEESSIEPVAGDIQAGVFCLFYGETSAQTGSGLALLWIMGQLRINPLSHPTNRQRLILFC